MWNGQPLLLNATALAENGIVTVTLGQYPPQRLRNVTMYIAVLMAESGFVASWNNSMGARMVELHEAKKIFEGQCKRSVFLTSRYHLCGKTKGWKSEVVSMALSPWQPQTQHFSFDVLRLDGDRHFKEDVRGGSVHITMAEPGAPAVWAVAQQGCKLNLVGGEISADQDQVDVSGVSHEGVRAFRNSPPAICTYFFSNCTSLSVLTGQDPRSYSIGANRTLRRKFDLDELVLGNHLHRITSPQLAQVLHCARESGREMDWVRGQLSPLSIDEDTPPRESKYFWILGDQQLFPGSIDIAGSTLKLEDLFKILSPKHSGVDEKLVRDVCTFLLDPTHQKDRAVDANIMRQAMVAALGANSGEAVQLAGQHCFNPSNPILRERFKKIAKLTWKALTSSSASARRSMLNVSLHFLEGALAKTMLVHSTTSNCVGCVDVLRELIQTGPAGPPLVFSHLSFRFGANLLALAAIKSTGPWLCTRELVIRTPSFQRLRGAESLRNLLEQMKLCEESPLASLDISDELLIDARDFNTLGPGLPKKVYFSVGTTASTQASQIFSVPREALNLGILEDFQVNFKDSAGLMLVCKEISRAGPAMLKNVLFRMVSNYHYIKVSQPAMKAMAEMVVALPNLEHFKCTDGDISKDGLEEFSRVLAPKASTLKLKSIDLAYTNLEGAAEDLGKALAMVPTLVQVVLGHTSMADVAYAGFLRPFVSREGSSLKKIYVGGSGFADGAAEVLAELMQKQGLESIGVSSTGVTDKGLSALGRALKVGECSLKEVNAAEIGTDRGVTALLMGLAHCPDLERASFYGTPLKEKTIEMAMKNVKNRDVWPKLEELIVKYGDTRYNLKSKDPLATAS